MLSDGDLEGTVGGGGFMGAGQVQVYVGDFTLLPSSPCFIELARH